MSVLSLGLLAMLIGGSQASARDGEREIEITIASRALRSDQVVLVHLPEEYSRTADRFPVIVVLDGENFARSAEGMADWLRMCERTPGLIVVSIPNRTFRERAFRFTTAWLKPDPKNRAGYLRNFSGGAKSFLTFLKDEAIPEIDRR